MNVMMAAREEVSQFMGQKNRKQRNRERQTRQQQRRVMVHQRKRLEESVQRGCLIVRVRRGKMCARKQACEQRKNK